MRSLVFCFCSRHWSLLFLFFQTCPWYIWGFSLFALHGGFQQDASGLFSSKLNIDVSPVSLLWLQHKAKMSLFILCFRLTSRLLDCGGGRGGTWDPVSLASVCYFTSMGCSLWVYKMNDPHRLLTKILFCSKPWLIPQIRLQHFILLALKKNQSTPFTCCRLHQTLNEM